MSKVAMELVRLYRKVFTDKAVYGELETATGWSCKTLELPWRNNSPLISCIPTGEYRCLWTRSARLSLLSNKEVYTYEVLGVPSRAGIRIHPANFTTQLRGCIALGKALTDIDADGILDLTDSKRTTDTFNQLMQTKPFVLLVA